MDVHLIRHTRPALGEAHCYGRLDPALAPGWQERAAELAAQLPSSPHILCSPDLRCRQLAEHLASASGDAPLVLEDLRELDFGDWEGLAWADIPRRDTTYWAKDLWQRAPPGGETYAALYERVAAVWGRLLLQEADQVLIIANTGPLRALLTIALELPASSFVRFHLDLGSLSRLSDASGGWRLEFANR